jgi:hypothetical protein
VTRRRPATAQSFAAYGSSGWPRRPPNEVVARLAEPIAAEMRHLTDATLGK